MCMGTFTEEWRPEEVTRAESFYYTFQMNSKFAKNWQDKGIGLRVNCREVTRKVSVSLSRSVQISGLWFPISGVTMSSFLQGWHLSHGSFISCFQEGKEGQSVPLEPAVSEVRLTQNNIPKWHILGDMFWTPSPPKSYMYLSVILTWCLYFVLCIVYCFSISMYVLSS